MTDNSKTEKIEIKRGRRRSTNALGHSTKEKILSTYESLIRKQRTADIPLDTICTECDIKKGTLLYHFGSKVGLQKQIVESYTQHLERCYQEGMKVAREKWPCHKPEIAGFVEWFRTYEKVTDPHYSEYGLAVLAMAAGSDDLIAPVNQWYESVFRRIRQAAGANMTALITILALEGLFFLGHYKVRVFDKTEIEDVLNELLERTRSESRN